MPQEKITRLIDGLNPNIFASIFQLGSTGALAVAIVDGSGAQITSFGGGGGGGGTSSNFGAAFPTAGTALGVQSGANMVALLLGQALMASSIPVTIASNQSSIPITLGTDSVGLAKESGGNLAFIAGAFKAVGTAAPANVLQIGYTNGSGNLVSWPNQSAGDGLSTVPTMMEYIFNGTNADRKRSVTNATNSIGTGIQAVGLVAQFDDVSPTAITENQFGNVRMSANRNLYGTIRDAAGNERGANVNASNQLSVSVDGVGVTATSLGKAEDAASASGDTGIAILAVRRDFPSTDVNAAGDYATVQTNRDGALWTAGAAAPTGGWLVATGTIGATKTDIGTANTPGAVGGWYFFNPNATVVYVQFFNAQASAVTLGTTAPVYSLGLPAGAAANVSPATIGLAHSTAISIAITLTRSGSTTPASTVDYNIFYKQ
jgi:hypothetical protein